MGWSCRASWRPVAVLSGALLAVFIAGCAPTSYTDLPPLIKDTRSILTEEQQKAAVGDLAAKKEANKAEALKEIEGKK